MKGLQIGIEFMAKLLISVFIISLIAVLLAQYLPDVSDNNCRQKQFDEINNLVNDAVDKRTSSSIKQFTVFSCVEYVDFGFLHCNPPERRGPGDAQRCYEISFVGGNDDSCEDLGVQLTDSFKNPTKSVEESCQNIPGSVRAIPGGSEFVEILPCDDCRGLKYTPGSYAVEVGAFSIKFLQETNQS